MDASAYLQRQGWRGDGHSLDHTDRGIKKPLLVSKKVDVLGVGLNKHQAVSDQWWLRAFDQGLKTFGTGKESALGAVQKHGVNRGGLYARFTQGEGVPGSIGQSPVGGSEANTGASTPVEPHQQPEGVVPVGMSATNNMEHRNGSNSKKRKRDDAPTEKRARHKSERSEKSEGVEQPPKRKVKSQAIYKYVDEAQRRGILSLGPNQALRANGKEDTLEQSEPSEAFKAIMSRAGLDPHSGAVNKQSKKAQKYDREKMKRAIKRAAKAYLEGEGPEVGRFAKKSKADKATKRSAHVQADGMDNREQEAEKESAAKARAAAGEARNASDRRSAEYDTGADEIKLNGTSRQSSKMSKGDKRTRKLQAMASAEGVTEEEIKQRLADGQTQTAADERTRVDEYRARKQGMNLEEYQKALEEGTVQTPKVKKMNLSDETLAEYAERARRKGVSVEEYIRRREEKRAVKQAEKSRGQDDGLEFVVDTTGDDSLAVKPPTDDLIDPDGVPLAFVDTTGDSTRAYDGTNQLDPRAWQGIKPKAMRKARQQWMKARREERKTAKLAATGAPALPPKKSKGERKVEARERFVRQILHRSRDALLADVPLNDDIAVTIDGVEGVPLVKMQTRDGPFRKEEQGLARTVARRVLRNVKREEKAKMGKGKGSKKRERSEKEARRNAGISGPTTRAKLDAGVKGREREALLG